MFSTNRKEARNAAEATTLIATGTEIKGDISFSGRLHIDGKIDGAMLSLTQRRNVRGPVENGATTRLMRVE